MNQEIKITAEWADYIISKFHLISPHAIDSKMIDLNFEAGNGQIKIVVEWNELPTDRIAKILSIWSFDSQGSNRIKLERDGILSQGVQFKRITKELNAFINNFYDEQERKTKETISKRFV